MLKFLKFLPLVGRIAAAKRAKKEILDIPPKFRALKRKYGDMPEDIKDLIDEIEEAVDAVREVLS
jgi:hypothetical protein